MTQILALVRHGSAIGRALALGETTALGLLSPGERGALVEARQAGARRALALWEPGLPPLDYLGVAQLLAAAARTVPHDLVVVGEGRSGAIAPALAESLGLPHVSGLVEARRDGEALHVRRLLRGVLRWYVVQGPAVLGFLVSPVPPSPPSAATADASVTELDLAAVGASAATLMWRRRLIPRPALGPPARPRLLADADALVQRLRREGLLGA